MQSYAAGSSDSWQGQQKRARDLINEHNTAKGYLPFSEMSEEAVCKFEFFESFAEWLVEEYKMAAGGGLKHTSVINHLQVVLQDANRKFLSNGTDKTKLFLSCVCPSKVNTNSAVWLRRIKAKITRVIAMRITKAGELLDGSETPLYLSTLQKVNEAYSKAGTHEANMRKFVLTTSQRSVSRAGEAAWITVDGLEWDPYFKCVFAQLPQLKTSKVRLVALTAGANRKCCWVLDIGDYLATKPPGHVWDCHNADWLVPELRNTDTPGTTIGSFLKALEVKTGATKYKDFAVPDLPPGCTAGGIRPGGCNMLGAHLPAELAVRSTGHDCHGVSTFFEYLDINRPLVMVGAVVLSGFPPYPYGQTGGMGPIPADCDWLETHFELDRSKLGVMLSELYKVDSCSNPRLQAEGDLRPLLKAAFATQVMYYEERVANGESYLVCKLLEELVFKHKFFASENEAKAGLVKWGASIRQRFVSDNLPLTAKQEHGGFAQVISAVQQQGPAFEMLEERMVKGLKMASDRFDRQLDIMEQKFEAHCTRLAARPPEQAPPHASLPGGPQIGATVVAPTSVAASPPTSTSAADASGTINLISPATSPDAQPAQSRRRLTLQNTPEALPTATIDSALRPPREGACPTMTATGKTGVEIFQWRAAPPGKRKTVTWANRADRRKATLSYDFFKAMCTDDEFNQLRESDDDGLRRKMVMKLNDLLVANLQYKYQRSVFDIVTQKHIGVIPRSLTDDNFVLLIGCIEKHHLHFKTINKADPSKLPWNNSTFKDWRSKHEAKDPTVAVILPEKKNCKGGGRKRSRGTH